MGTAGLIKIKRRLKSVGNTRKITKAMGLVATSKLRKVRKDIDANEYYFNSIENIAKTLMTAMEDRESVFFDNQCDDNSPELYIVLTSDTGLCGGFNNSVVSYLKSFVGDKMDSKIVVVGAKGLPYARRTNLEIVSTLIDVPDTPTIKEIKQLYEGVLFMYKNKEVKSVNVVYTEFISHIKQEVKIEKILPVAKEATGNNQVIIEPDLESTFNSAIDMYMMAKIRRMMLQSKASEYSTRVVAMDGATQNANDIIQGLNIQYNRIRQSIITQEISEIIGGAEAQK